MVLGEAKNPFPGLLGGPLIFPSPPSIADAQSLPPPRAFFFAHPPPPLFRGVLVTPDFYKAAGQVKHPPLLAVPFFRIRARVTKISFFTDFLAEALSRRQSFFFFFLACLFPATPPFPRRPPWHTPPVSNIPPFFNPTIIRSKPILVLIDFPLEFPTLRPTTRRRSRRLRRSPDFLPELIRPYPELVDLFLDFSCGSSLLYSPSEFDMATRLVFGSTTSSHLISYEPIWSIPCWNNFFQVVLPPHSGSGSSFFLRLSPNSVTHFPRQPGFSVWSGLLNTSFFFPWDALRVLSTFSFRFSASLRPPRPLTIPVCPPPARRFAPSLFSRFFYRGPGVGRLS